MDINEISSILETAVRLDASDVHLMAFQPPIFRIHGELKAIEAPAFSPQQLEALLTGMLTEPQRLKFQENKELDFSYACLKDYQLRVNFHYSEDNVAAAIRIASVKIKGFEELNLHPVVNELAKARQGIILLSGTAGSGKSTTMSCLLDMINKTRKCKIITIEDPIEYHHNPINSYFIQREVGKDTESFTTAMKYALRQDPDVVSIGEIRDLESIRIALMTAETGHLVITTVHASDAIATLNRIVSMFPLGNRDEILAQLSSNIVAVINQTLLPRKDNLGRILATEIMLGDMPVKNLIRRNDLKEIRAILDSNEREGMHSLEVSLANLYKDGLISYETAQQNIKHHNSEKLKEAMHAKSKKLKFLVFDSDIKEIKLIGTTLMKTYNCEVLYCENGREGITLAQKEKPDVILLNSSLKDMNGYDVAAKVKQLSSTDISMIIMSDNYDLNGFIDAKKAGAKDYVMKTKDFGLILDSINKIYE